MEDREFAVERTKVMPCNCIHSFQNERYGLSMRVHSLTEKEGKLGGAQCVER
jgi:hypothetical protein